MIPKIDLTTFFLSIASSAFYSLGVGPSGRDPNLKIDLDVAKQNIELLELMQEKTKGNRNAEEDKLIEQLLYQIRMIFVEHRKDLEKK